MRNLLIPVIFCLLLLTGCDLIDRIIWSPDGERLAVLTSDGLRLGKDSGDLSKPVLKEVRLLRWLQDSSKAVVVTASESTEWKDINGLLSKEELAKSVKVAGKVWNSKSTVLSSDDDSMVAIAVLRLKNQYGALAVKRRLGTKKSPDPITPVTISSVQLVDLSEGSPKGKLLWRTLETIDELRVSPSGKLAAIVINREPFAWIGTTFYKIILLPIDGGLPRTAVESLADIPDWSRDGRWIYYISYPALPRDVNRKQLYDEQHPWVGSLNRCEVADETGTMLAKFGTPEKILEVLSAHSSGVRCLSDGSIIFNSKRRQFPSIVNGKAQAGLFKLKPDLKSLEPIGTLGFESGEDVQIFEPNQDGSLISIANKNGRISVLDVASDKVTVLEKGDSGDKDLKFLPSWRTKDELCFPARAGGESVQVVLQSMSDLKQRKVLSSSWASLPPFLREMKDAFEDVFDEDEKKERKVSPARKKKVGPARVQHKKQQRSKP